MSKRLSNPQSLTITLGDNNGPSQILPFLYVGCQDDANSSKIMQDLHITHVINVSTNGERAAFLKDENDVEHFLRIPINDCLNAQLFPYLDQAYNFIENARMNHGRVFIHCLAGISRSPALAIAYVMRYLSLSFDDAYKYVKQRRPQISPNFNFIGQLSEYEHKVSKSSSVTATPPVVKCISNETPRFERCRLIQVEGRSNFDQNIESKVKTHTRPNTLQNSNEPKLTRPDNISLNQPRIRLINSSFSYLNDMKSTDTPTKTVDRPSSLINTYVQQSNTSKSLEQWTSSQTLDSNMNRSQSDVLSSSLELIVS